MSKRPEPAGPATDPYGEHHAVWAGDGIRASPPWVYVLMLVAFWSCVAALLAGRAVYLDANGAAPQQPEYRAEADPVKQKIAGAHAPL